MVKPTQHYSNQALIWARFDHGQIIQILFEQGLKIGSVWVWFDMVKSTQYYLNWAQK